MSIDYDLLEYASEYAQKRGVKELIIKYIDKTEHQIRFSNSQIDIYKEWDNKLMEVFLSVGRKYLTLGRKINFITIQNPTKESIDYNLGKAIKALKSLPKSLLYWGMEEEQQEYQEISGLYDERIKTFVDKAPDLVNKAIDASRDEGAEKTAGVLYFGDINTGVITGYGNGGTYKSSYYKLTVRSFADAESSGQDIVVGRSMNDLQKHFSEAGSRAGRLAKMAVGGEQGKPGKYDVILSPTVAANVFNHLADGANPIYIIGRMSCLRGQSNKQIGPENLDISDDATMPEGLNSRPFDFEGVPSQKTPLIENGEFRGTIQNTSSAKIWKWLNWLKFKFGKGFKTTGNSYLGGLMDEDIGPKVLAPIPSNYVYSQGDYSLEEIIEESSNPTVYITSNWYTRFTNFQEGLFSTIPRDGMFLIENGEIKNPIRKLRLTETLLGMLKRIDLMGNNRKQISWWEVATPTFIPTIKVKDCNLTAATE